MSKLRVQTIQDNGPAHKYFAMIPKIAIMELTPHELALYCNYKQTAAENGTAFKSNRTLAAECKMSVRKVQESRKSLEEKGYISVEYQDMGGKINSPARVTITDIWQLNYDAYAPPMHLMHTPHAPHAHPHAPHAHPHAPHAYKEELYKKNPIEEEPTNQESPLTPTDSNKEGLLALPRPVPTMAEVADIGFNPDTPIPEPVQQFKAELEDVAETVKGKTKRKSSDKPKPLSDAQQRIEDIKRELAVGSYGFSRDSNPRDWPHGRLGKITTWLLEKGATPDDVRRFYIWYTVNKFTPKGESLSKPRSEDAFKIAYNDYLNSDQRKADLQVVQNPEIPEWMLRQAERIQEQARKERPGAVA